MIGVAHWTKVRYSQRGEKVCIHGHQLRCYDSHYLQPIRRSADPGKRASPTYGPECCEIVCDSLMLKLRHTVPLGLVRSGVPLVGTFPLSRRSPHPACARRSSPACTFSAGSRSGARQRGRRSAAMADHEDAAPHSDAADVVPNGGMPNGGASPERDGSEAAASSAPVATGTLSVPNPSRTPVIS